MTSALQREYEIEIRSLYRMIPNLARALAEKGVAGSPLHDFLERNVKTECISCGISLSGRQLNDGALGNWQDPGEQKKLDRIRRGDCARNGCDGRYYLVELSGLSGAELGLLWERVEILAAFPEAEPDQDHEPAVIISPADRFRQALSSRWALGAAGVLLLLWWSPFGWRIPGLSSKPRVFIVSPGSSVNAASATPLTNGAPQTLSVPIQQISR